MITPLQSHSGTQGQSGAESQGRVCTNVVSGICQECPAALRAQKTGHGFAFAFRG